MRRRLALAAVSLVAMTSASTSGTLSVFTGASVRTQSVSTPPLLAVGLSSPRSSGAESYTVSSLAPGGTADELVNIRNDGSTPPDIGISLTTATSTLLDTDATYGLFAEVDDCTTVWQQAAAGAVASCAGTLSVVVASTALATSNGAGPTLVTTGLNALSSGGIDHLRVHLTLPAGAPTAYGSLTSQPAVTIWSAPPGAPTSTTAVAADGQITAGWVAPAFTAGASITGYTATASPAGATCTTTATSCVISGLTDGITESVTVTATTTYGSGTASAKAVATPYPASLFTSGNGLSLWLDGADSTTLYSGSGCTGATSSQGAAIGCWKDKSSAGENFSQATTADQPTVGTLNSLSTPYFSSSADVLNSLNGSGTYQTVIAAALPQSSAAGWDEIFGQQGADFAIRPLGLATTNSNDWSANTGTPTSAWSNGRQATNASVGSTAVVTAVSQSPETISASVSETFLSRGIIGDVAEVVAFNTTLTTPQRRTVEDYLARKWGVTLTPDPPVSPSATAAAGGATVSWSAPPYNGGAAVTGYVATASPGGATCTTTGATTCNLASLANGQAYSVSVAATNSVGTGATSSSVSVTPSTLPGAPTGVAATPSANALAVGWSVPSSTGGSAITSYTATASPGGASCTTASTTCSITGLAASTSYTLTVTATNGSGTGAASATATASTGAAGSTPGAPAAPSVTPGDTQVTVAWSVPPVNGGSSITGYTATASPSGLTCTTTATSCTVSGLTDGVTQTVTVTATNAYGTGPASTTLTTTPYPAVMVSGSGMTLWLDGADPTTLLASSSCSGPTLSSGIPIGCWKDKSGNNENYLQSLSGQYPSVGSLGSLGAVDFTSTSQVLTSANGSGQYQTVFVASKPLTTPSGFDTLFGLSGTDFSVRLSVANPFTAPNANDWSYNTGTPPADWSNGVQAAEPSIGATGIAVAQSQSASTASTSVSNTFLSRGLLGYVAEVVVFKTVLTTTQRQAVEDYLARKWAVTIAPDPPGTPTLSPGSASLAASWAAPGYNGGSAVTGYTATASPGGGTCTASGTTHCTISGLTTGTSYSVTVTATNSTGIGSASAAASATAG